MVQLLKAYHTYIFIDEGLDKSFEDEECAKKLSEAHWPKLTTLIIACCNLKGPSLKCIFKANWPLLTTLCLGKETNT